MRQDQLKQESEKCDHGLFFGTTCEHCRIAELEEALTLAWAAMGYMGDILNDMDAVSARDLSKTAKAFRLVPEALAASEVKP